MGLLLGSRGLMGRRRALGDTGPAGGLAGVGPWGPERTLLATAGRSRIGHHGRVWFGVLGPLQVRDERGQPVAAGGPRLRALL